MNRNISLQYGLLAGISCVAYVLLFYFWDPRMIFMPTTIWISLLIYLPFMWYGCNTGFKTVGESYSFQLALKDAFTVYVFANIIYYTFYFLLMKFIDPSLIYVQQEVSLANLERYSGYINQAQIENMKTALENGELDVKLSDILFAFGSSAIGGFIIALGLAGIFVKSKGIQ